MINWVADILHCPKNLKVSVDVFNNIIAKSV